MDSITKADTSEIVRGLKLILEEGQVTELRVLDAVTSRDRRPHVESGYFDDAEKLAEALKSITQAKGFYFVPNVLNPDLLARANNRLRAAGKEPTTADHDIEQRRWLLIDADAKRPAGISASDPEHEAAIELAFRIRAELASEGWPEPIVADSGNGAHLLYRIDLAADDGGLVRRCLEALAKRFNTDLVLIDTSVHNPARIWKLYGTWSAKGDSTSERPHRLSRILERPAANVLVSEQLLTTLADYSAATVAAAVRDFGGGTSTFDLDAWIDRHGLVVQGPAPWHDGRIWVFPTCPWNSDHSNSSAFVLQQTGGAIAAGCHHNGCQGRDWHALRDIVEPGWRQVKRSSEADAHGEDDADIAVDDDGRGPSRATRLVELATRSAEFWHTPDGDPYATLLIADHHEHWPIKSKSFKLWLGREYYNDTKSAPSAQAMLDATGVLASRAIFDGAEHPVFVRCAAHGGKVYLDLVNRAWSVVEVDEHGWRVVQDPPVRFRRAKAMLALPTPTKGSVDDLRQFVNVLDQDWPLMVTWLLAAMYPRGPYPLLSLAGEQGSGKSTSARVLRRLLDPNSAALRSEPRNPHDLAIAANNGWLIALDNLSKLPEWLSDALCRLSTGGGFATRMLYENDLESIFDAMRPVILTGIEDVINRGDLLDRALIIGLSAIPEDRRRSEAEFWAAFETALPGILGGLLTGMSAAIRNLPTTKLAMLPRMADFAVLATAAEPGLGLPPGEFMAAYNNNRVDANILAIENEPIARFVIALVARESWAGTATDLLREFNLAADDATRRGRDWPKSAQALSGKIKRLAPNLRRLGIDVEYERSPDKARRRMITLRTSKATCVRSVRTVQNPDFAGLPSDGADAPAELPDACPDAAVQQILGTADASDAPDAESAPYSPGDLAETEWSG